MSYKYKDTETSIPLAVESIEAWIAERKKNFDLEDPDNPSNLFRLHDYRAELYRDVLIAIRGRASHAIELAEAALKLEEIYI